MDELQELKDKQGVGWIVYDHWLKSSVGLLERHEEKGTDTPRHHLDVLVMRVCSAKTKADLLVAVDALTVFSVFWSDLLECTTSIEGTKL